MEKEQKKDGQKDEWEQTKEKRKDGTRDEV